MRCERQRWGRCELLEQAVSVSLLMTDAKDKKRLRYKWTRTAVGRLRLPPSFKLFLSRIGLQSESAWPHLSPGVNSLWGRTAIQTARALLKVVRDELAGFSITDVPKVKWYSLNVDKTQLQVYFHRNTTAFAVIKLSPLLQRLFSSISYLCWRVFHHLECDIGHGFWKLLCFVSAWRSWYKVAFLCCFQSNDLL